MAAKKIPTRSVPKNVRIKKFPIARNSLFLAVCSFVLSIPCALLFGFVAMVYPRTSEQPFPLVPAIMIAIPILSGMTGYLVAASGFLAYNWIATSATLGGLHAQVTED